MKYLLSLLLIFLWGCGHMPLHAEFPVGPVGGWFEKRIVITNFLRVGSRITYVCSDMGEDEIASRSFRAFEEYWFLVFVPPEDAWRDACRVLKVEPLR